MKIVKISLDGSSYLMPPEHLTPEVILTDFQVGDVYQFELVDMSQEEIDNLPEFDGF